MSAFPLSIAAADGGVQIPFPSPKDPQDIPQRGGGSVSLLYVLLPLLIVLSTLLFLVLVFLIAIVWVRRRRGIRLVEEGGPLDLSRNDGVLGEGGIAGVEQRWLEQVSPEVAEGYKRGKDYQQQYAPASVPSDITLSQFLTIQEKGVSAWCFEPDYESNLSLYVESRTEITFMADGPGMAMREGGGNTVLANLPVPKLNEVYYFEAKMYEKPTATEVVVGLATKPYPSFRLPGWNKVSVGYFSSDGFKCHNYPFTAASHGPPLAEGDVLGVGYRPRTGTVFFTRNGKKLDDCYTGLSGHNLFPAVGANGACSVHVNLGQSGFVFIEANVKKWGLAPMMGTLAPPPAYGSERGSILLEAGYGAPGGQRSVTPDEAARHVAGFVSPFGSSSSTSHLAGQAIPSTPRGHRRTQFQRDRRPGSLYSSSIPVRPSPLRATENTATNDDNQTTPTRRAFRDDLGPDDAESSGSAVARSRYHSPTDGPELNRTFPAAVGEESTEEDLAADETASSVDATSNDGRSSALGSSTDLSHNGFPNPPTPNPMDISLRSMAPHEQSPSYFGGRARREGDSSGESAESAETVQGVEDEARRQRREARRERRTREREAQQQHGIQARLQAFVGGWMNSDQPPPGYSPLDPNVYSQGVPTDLPPEIISQAFEERQPETQRNTEANAQQSMWTRIFGGS